MCLQDYISCVIWQALVYGISKSQQYTYDYTSLVVMKPNKSKHILNTLDKNAFVTQGFIQIYEILTC